MIKSQFKKLNKLQKKWQTFGNITFYTYGNTKLLELWTPLGKYYIDVDNQVFVAIVKGFTWDKINRAQFLRKLNQQIPNQLKLF